MEKDLIFFTEKDNNKEKVKLTSTSANHISNLAKEYVRTLKQELNNINFVNVKVALVGTAENSEIQEGVNSTFLDTLSNNLSLIADVQSLIAWLREAIKARDALLKEINGTSSYDYAAANNIPYPESPVIGHILTEDEYLSTLTVKERNRYYHLETLCAVIGQYIHPDGTFADKREELNDALRHKHKVSGSGRDALIYTYTPTVDPQKVEDTFFRLQALHREYQAELNSIKFKIEKAITDDEAKKRALYEEALSRYNAEIAELNASLATWKTNETQRVSSLKIIIPEELKDIYSTVTALGK